MHYVITCGDEGVQINEGTRIGIVGAGIKLSNFSGVVEALKKTFSEPIAIAASEENDWVRTQFDLNTWEQASATMQQQAAALADQHGLLYAGLLPFADPQALDHGIKGHMVRPKAIHIANKIVFTLAGGEHKYHLGHYLVSADWVAEADQKLVKEVISAQVEYYTKLAKSDKTLPLMYEIEGDLPAEKVRKNRMALEKLGFKGSIIEYSS